MTKILVADDEADLETLIRQKFRQKIRDKHYEFVFAINGKDALEKMQKHPDIAIVLSDINMPEMDGLTLLTHLNDANPLTKTVMVSAYGDMDNIRTAMNRGAFDFITKPVNFDDLDLTIQKTIKYVTQLQDTLKAIKENNILKMYVDKNVLNFMGKKEYETSLMASETVDATVAFIDICGFTAITEKETPDAVITLLNNYFDLISKELIEQEGIIDKFMGDCVMSVFKGPFHLDRAIDACLNIREKIGALPRAGTDARYHPQVAIGINSGEMVSGNVGSAALKRLDFTVIGDAVNIAQRLQSTAKPGQILINETSYNKVKQSFECKSIGSIKLKNKTEPMTLYEVIV